MSVETPQPEINQLQRPEVNIESVVPGDPAMLTAEQLPWMTSDLFEMPTVRVRMADGTEFSYGSAVSANGSVEKLAHEVPVEQSRQTEEAMFKALPFLFDGKLPPNIKREITIGSDLTIFKVARKGNDVPRLLFTWFQGEQGPTVVKLGIAKHKKQMELQSVMTGKAQRKHDGGSR